MSDHFLKAPASDLDHTIDWTGTRLKPGETIEGDLGWTVFPLGAALVVDGHSHTPATTTVRLTGGIPGESYLVSSLVQTSAGRVLQSSLLVRVAHA